MIIVLDSGVLGYITHPNTDLQDTEECRDWYLRLASQAHIFCIPEIIDYESRRKFIQIDSQISINHLNELKDVLEYLPITTSVMLQAAQLWADTRNTHYRTKPPEALDVDVILAAQAMSHSREINRTVVVATTDVGDLSLLGLDARKWRDIPNRRQKLST